MAAGAQFVGAKFDRFAGFDAVGVEQIANHAVRPLNVGDYTFGNGSDRLRILRSNQYLGAHPGCMQRISKIMCEGCDNPLAYGMLAKTGQGIGLLGSFTLIEPCLVPLEIGVRVSVPLFLLALTERLNARPVRLVFDWLSEIFGPNNPWFSDEFKLNNPRSEYDAGGRKMFNLE